MKTTSSETKDTSPEKATRENTGGKREEGETHGSEARSEVKSTKTGANIGEMCANHKDTAPEAQSDDCGKSLGDCSHSERHGHLGVVDGSLPVGAEHGIIEPRDGDAPHLRGVRE